MNRKLNMLKRIDRFILDYAITPGFARLTAAHADVTGAIAALESTLEQQLSARRQAAGGVDLRSQAAAELRAYLKNVCRTGRSLEDIHPGIGPIFRLPRTESYPALLASARSMIEAATPIAASFHDAGLPPTFIAELNALLAAFEVATGQKHSGRVRQVKSTAALQANANAGLLAATKLDAIMRNLYRANPEMLAAWISARHIEAPSRPKKEASTRSASAAIPNPPVSPSLLTEPKDSPATPAAPIPLAKQSAPVLPAAFKAPQDSAPTALYTMRAHPQRSPRLYRCSEAG